MRAFLKYPRVGHSPEASMLNHRSKSVLEVRGNVYDRLSGMLPAEKRTQYLEAAQRLREEV
jgi:hypothetical protein